MRGNIHNSSLLTYFTVFFRALALCCILLSSAHSDHLAVSHTNIHPLQLDEEQNNDKAFSTVRDLDGFLWVATDNGVKRYDGYKLKTFDLFTDKSSVNASNDTRSLLLQDSGALWVGGKALSLYQRETETFKSFDIPGNSVIQSLFLGKNGILWIGTEGSGLIGFSTTTNEFVYSFFTEDSTRFISSINERKSSEAIWVSTNSGLYSFNTSNHNVTPYQLPIDGSATSRSIRGSIEDQNGNVWLATYQGLVVLNPHTKKFKTYTKSPSIHGHLRTNNLQSIFEDSKGQVWIGTDKHGVYKYQPETDNFIIYPASNSSAHRFPSTSINSISEDSEGSLWFTAHESGVFRITEHLEKFSILQYGGKYSDETSHLSENDINSLIESQDGSIWIATDGGGLNRYNPSTQVFEYYKHKPNDPLSISSNDIISLGEGLNGFIWVGTSHSGLNKLDPKTGKFTRIRRDPNAKNQQTLTNNSIFRIEPHSSGNLYLSTWNKGLQIYNPITNTFQSYSPSDRNGSSTITNDSIHDFLERSDKKVWIAGHSGLELFDPASGSFTNIPIKGVNVIYDLHQDRQGSLWLATSTGLIRHHPETNATKYFSTKEGLVNNIVASIEEDQQGNFWLGTRRGLIRFSPYTESFTSFTEKDGLASSYFNPYSHLKTRSGQMYFGGKNGLSTFNPNRLPTNENAPKIHLTSFELFQKTVEPETSPWLSFSIDLTTRVELPHSQKDILFEFSALNFIAPTNNLYKYRLKGLENEWIKADSTQRRVRYTNLSPGSYTFQVIGSNNEGVWNGAAKEIDLIILPPWWQTWWAWIIYTLALASTVYLFSVWRLRMTHLHQKELETIVKIRTQELKEANEAVNQLNSELEQRVVHRTKELSIEIEERRNAEKRSSHLAFHDPLTGLPNRSWLLSHLEELIDRTQDHDFEFAVLFVGGDRFKQINDTHGHLLGDLLLVAAAKRLTEILPKHFHTVRLGSDEFTIVIDQIESTEQVTAVAEMILRDFKEPFVFEQAKMNFNVSIGMLICSNEYNQPTQILRNVDIAMNYAKSRGRGIYQMFDSKILRQTLEYASLQADLQQALRKSQFSVVFQPIIDLETGMLSGFEALLRWYHPYRNMVPPDEFIPIAEELGIIFDIGLWVLEEACKQLKYWHTKVDEEHLPTIAVNLSALQLKQADLLSKFDKIFSTIGSLREKIKLEITESALMENTVTVDRLLESFRQRGIELAIDDFGTGYSSLSYLDKLPVQVLKIDRSFVDAMFDKNTKTDGAHEIVRATIALAHNLKMKVVAEGIETKEQMAVLKEYQCDYGQGYLISRPLSAEAATEFLTNNKNKNK